MVVGWSYGAVHGALWWDVLGKVCVERYGGRMVLWRCAWSIMVIGCSYVVDHRVWLWWDALAMPLMERYGHPQCKSPAQSPAVQGDHCSLRLPLQAGMPICQLPTGGSPGDA